MTDKTNAQKLLDELNRFLTLNKYVPSGPILLSPLDVIQSAMNVESSEALQRLYDKIDKQREFFRSEYGDKDGSVVGMGYCLDMILAMKK